MASLEAYEANLQHRLEELRKKDEAYELHGRVLVDALIFSAELHGDSGQQTVLDCGCGLGFMTAWLQHLGWQTTGIDISERTIELATAEHDGVPFYAEPADVFAEKMSERNMKGFDHALLNMVAHSVDDATVRAILEGVRQCVKPEGTLHMIVPKPEWLMQKLIEYAQDMEMKRGPGIAWVRQKLRDPKVALPVKIRGGSYYPEPITIYNRTLEQYGDMLLQAGFGVQWNTYNSETDELIDSSFIPYLNMFDYISSAELISRDRTLLMSFAMKDMQ